MCVCACLCCIYGPGLVEFMCADFFKNLDNRCGPLSLHSTMPHLVTYVNAALKELGFTYS